MLKKLITVVQKIAQAQYDGLKADGVNVSQANGAVAGQIVPHIHFPVIPRCEGDSHDWTAPQREYDEADEMQKYAEKAV